MKRKAGPSYIRRRNKSRKTKGKRPNWLVSDTAKKASNAVVGFNARSAVGIRTPYSLVSKPNKKVAFKGKKAVRVSRPLRQKINKVLQGKDITGHWTQLEFGFVENLHYGIGKQCYGHNISELKTYTLWDFSPEVFLHCASVLWNAKNDTQKDTRKWDDKGNIGYDFSNINITPPGKNTRVGNTAKFHVKWSKVCYNLKNNSQITRNITIVLCAPRSPMAASAVNDSSNFSDGVVATVKTDPSNPYAAWEVVCGQERRDGTNISNVTPDFLHDLPNHHPGFNRLYKTEITKIVLEPGQTYCYEVKGPSNQLIDFKKYFKLDVFMPQQTYCRFPVFIMEGELFQKATGTHAGYGIGYSIGHAAETRRGEVIFERKFECSLTMPETTGANFTSFTAAQGPLQNNLRKDCYAKYNYGYFHDTMDMDKIDETNPQTVTENPT